MKVRLTWKTFEGNLVTEEVYQLNGDESLPFSITTNEGVGNTVDTLLATTNDVLFEDEEGIFSLSPDQIVSIEVRN